ncbi:ras gtpase-related [Anaeramoeba flamelloides]|uniref:Ras gtpase-related n=1 Tax=Anaeramoeba flamelloides TaxID=1746091 RepID=A0AAV7Y8S0_9EUKA|nr:ras gtpase-related [Anaeramoeba flamelloides]KAJ6235377.1 ras gtpase-related [Anaeramoeba flamelloides]
MSKKADFEYSLVLLGSGGTGKSSVTVQLCYNRFVINYDPTIEDIHRKQCEIDGEVAFLEILDTAGQEDYAAMRPSYIRSGEGFLLVYSVIDRSSFELIPTLRDEILMVKDSGDEPIVIAANKIDLESKRKITTEEGKELAESLGCGYIETSAKLDIGVEDAFYDLVRLMRVKRGPKKKKKKKCLIL